MNTHNGAERPDLSQERAFLARAGVLFFAVSLVALIALIYLLSTRDVPSPATSKLELGSINQRILNRVLLDYYLPYLYAPVALLIGAILAATIGYALLRAAGTASRQVIPRHDYELLSKLIIENNTPGIDQYIRLSSLTGVVGNFTKVGLSGLPLATIGLTFVFAVLAAFNSDFLDLTKLTLGAFIGSYVQRTVSERADAAGGREARAGELPHKAETLGSPLT